MQPSRTRPDPDIPHPFIWRPGMGINDACMERMRDHTRRPTEPMGEAWFMGETRHMFDFLLRDLDDFSLEDLRRPLEEIAYGNSSFGPMQEWTVWYRYLLAQLLPRNAERSFGSLYQHLVTAFIAVHPRQIDEPYPGFAEDAMHTLGRSLMDPVRWDGDRLAIEPPEDPFGGGRHAAFEWSGACGNFSAGMFFCAKYLDERELAPWLDSVFAIRCPLWTTQLYTWLLATYPLLTGRVLRLGDLETDSPFDVEWLGAHVLNSDFTGIYEPLPIPLPLLSPQRCEFVLSAARGHLSQTRFFDWLNAIKPYAYLETMLGSKPSRFADTFNID